MSHILLAIVTFFTPRNLRAYLLLCFVILVHILIFKFSLSTCGLITASLLYPLHHHRFRQIYTCRIPEIIFLNGPLQPRLFKLALDPSHYPILHHRV
jgi:hypothetical protein